jgi:hypothetical protein
MKGHKYLKIGVIASSIFLFILLFERINVESYDEDMIFVGNNWGERLKHDIFIVNALLVVTTLINYLSLSIKPSKKPCHFDEERGENFYKRITNCTRFLAIARNDKRILSP